MFWKEALGIFKPFRTAYVALKGFLIISGILTFIHSVLEQLLVCPDKNEFRFC